MPIYEYACSACDHRTDILLGINDPGPHFCPSCGKPGTMRKLFAPPTIHYRGTGWAKKDRGGSSRRSSKSSGDSTSVEPGAPKGSGDGGSSDSPSSGSSSSTTSPSRSGSED